MEGFSNFSESNRKIRKPLMERKRRARINRSLDELYQLLTETEFAPKGTKLEKADILEMTVQYVKHLKHAGHSKEIEENLDNLMMERYRLGFERCAEEVETVVDLPLREKINRHLKFCLEKVKIEYRNRSKVAGKCRKSPSECSEAKDSKLSNGDVLLLLSSSDMMKCGAEAGKMWRPWW